MIIKEKFDSDRAGDQVNFDSFAWDKRMGLCIMDEFAQYNLLKNKYISFSFLW